MSKTKQNPVDLIAAAAKMQDAMEQAQEKLDLYEVGKRVQSARAQVVQKNCMFGSLLLKLKPVASWDVQTMATDGTHMFYNPEYVSKQTGPLLQSDCAHEALHPAFCHHTRRGNRRFDWWNEACDYVINPILREAGFQMWEDGLLREDMVGLNAEQAFRKLADERGGQQPGDDGESNDADDNDEDTSQTEHPSQPRPADDGNDDQQDDSQDAQGDDAGDQGQDSSDESGDQQGESQGDSGDDDQQGEGDGAGQGEGESQDDDAQGAGQGAGQSQDGGKGQSQVPSFGGAGAILDSPASTPEEVAREEAEWKIAVQQAANVHKAQVGDVGGNMLFQIEDLCEPIAPWRELLKQYFENLAADDYTWNTPNRRHVGDGLYLPALRSERMPPFLFVGDASGSISSQQEALSQMQAELQMIIDDLQPEYVDVIFHDTRVTDYVRFEEGEDLVLDAKGGGGTRFAPVCDYINNELGDEDYAVIIWFTDMATSDFDQCVPPDAPVLFIDWTGRCTDPEFGDDIIPMKD